MQSFTNTSKIQKHANGQPALALSYDSRSFSYACPPKKRRASPAPSVNHQPTKSDTHIMKTKGPMGRSSWACGFMIRKTAVSMLRQVKTVATKVFIFPSL